MSNRIKRLAVLGSTGSIGQQTLDVVRSFPERFKVIALAGRKLDLLATQVSEFKPAFVYFPEESPRHPGLEGILTREKVQRLPMEAMTCHPSVDMSVIATSGRVGLVPVLAAVKAGRTIALANKESLVMAGEVVTGEARKSGARIIPIDSEHSALFQCLRGERGNIAGLILTASGGPLLRCSPAEIAGVTVAQALKHPSWQMGKKVTIDSATLMNKGLEVIEAHWLFGIPFDKIRVLVHPQSIVHSMVEFADGAIKAQLSWPDMRLPIQYALSYPARLANERLPRLDWGRAGQLTFEEPDLKAFPCLRLAIEAGRKGGTYPAVLCGADEEAVELFLAERIGFVEIASIIERVLERHQSAAHPDIEQIIAADAWARNEVLQIATGGGKCC